MRTLTFLQVVGLVLPVLQNTQAVQPANDQFLPAPALTNNTASVRLDGATVEPGESTHGGFPAAHSVWWSRNLGENRDLWLSIGGARGCTLVGAVYLRGDPITGGVGVSNVVEIARVVRSANGAWLAAVRFNTRQGGDARIVLDVATEPGPAAYSISLSLTAPEGLEISNDHWANAAEFPNKYVYRWDSPAELNWAVQLGVDLIGTTAEAGEPGHVSDHAERSVWYRWTAPESGTYTLVTSSRTTNSAGASVYIGDSLATLKRSSLASFDPLTKSGFAIFPAHTGTMYWLALDVVDATSPPSISCALFQGATNDDFARRLPVAFANGIAHQQFKITSALSESGALRQAPQWFELTFPESGTYDFQSHGLRMDYGLFRETQTGLTLVRTNSWRQGVGGFRLVAVAGEKMALQIGDSSGWPLHFYGWQMARNPRYDPVDAPSVRLSAGRAWDILNGGEYDQMLLHFTGKPQRLYQVETSFDLREWKLWREVAKSNPEITVDLSDGAGAGSWFRVVAPE